MTALSERIVRARDASGLTLDAAAVRLGLAGRIYASHEAGKATPKPGELQRYAEAFGVSVGWLTAGVGSGPRASDPTNASDAAPIAYA